MKKIFILLSVLLAALLFDASSVFYAYQISMQNATVTGTQSTGIIGSGAAYHKLTWTVSGTVSTCSVQLDSSVDGITWNSGDVVSSTSCTSSGNTISTSKVVNYIRINLTALSGTGAKFNGFLTGYILAPAGTAPANPFPSIANLQFRLEADCITAGPCAVPSNGTNITTWADQSTNNFTATVASGTCTYNTNQNNSLGAVTFSSCHLSFTAIPWNAGGAGITEFVVLKITNNSAVNELTTGTAASFSYQFGKAVVGGSLIEQAAENDNSSDLGHGTAAPGTAYHQMNVTYDNATNPAFRIDRTVDATVSGVHGGTGGSTSGLGFDKPDGANAFPFTGSVQFIAIYDRKLSGAEITQMETYLNIKYGL